MEDYSEKMQRRNQYIEALEEERRKIQVFQRELPLCLELVTQAIEGCRQQLPCAGTTDYFHRRQQQSDCSEQTSSDGPVLEEFIPIKKCSSDDDGGDENDDDDDEQSHKPNINTEKSGKKSDWLRSVQLWNQTPDPPHKQDSPKKESITEVKKNGGAFRPFNKQKDAGKSKSPPAVPTAAASSSAGTDSGGSGGGRREEHKQGESQRKQRRCWSPELHRRFLNALQQLGGPHVATPKQIREFMKVDGLTNDEVKSHLQKYRLHTRRPSSGIHNNGSTQAPQFVVVGGIWVQPSEYAKMGATTQSGEATKVSSSNGIYAPVAALPPPSLPQASSSVTQRQQKHKQPKHSHSEERGSHCNSPATSSSTHTTTASPVY